MTCKRCGQRKSKENEFSRYCEGRSKHYKAVCNECLVKYWSKRAGEYSASHTPDPRDVHPDIERVMWAWMGKRTPWSEKL